MELSKKVEEITKQYGPYLFNFTTNKASRKHRSKQVGLLYTAFSLIGCLIKRIACEEKREQPWCVQKENNHDVSKKRTIMMCPKREQSWCVQKENNHGVSKTRTIMMCPKSRTSDLKKPLMIRGTKGKY